MVEKVFELYLEIVETNLVMNIEIGLCKVIKSTKKWT